MEMYVDKLPNKCLKCPCFNSAGYMCNINKRMLDTVGKGSADNSRDEKCPLKLIENYKGPSKKVLYNKFNGYRGTRFKCPSCNKAIENCIDFVGEYHCKHCGQSVVYPKFRVVNNVGELYFDEQE